MARQLIGKDVFTYTAVFTSIAAAAQQIININIQADADFEWISAVQTSDIAGAAVTESTRVQPLATVLLTDSGSNRQLMDAAVPIPSIFGDGRFPFILPQSRVFSARSNLVVQVTNYSAATTYRIQLGFCGIKYFYAG